MRNLRMILMVSMICLCVGCANDVLQEDDIIFDFELTDDIWEGFYYFDHTTPQIPLDINFPVADDRSLFLC